MNHRTAGSYESQWQTYRRRRNLALIFLYGAIPFWIVAFVAGDALQREVVAALLAFIWLVAVMLSIWWAGEFRCPRCWRRFGALGSKGFLGMWSRGVFDETCQNCKLRKFAESA